MLPQLKSFHHLVETEIRKQKFGKSPASLYEPIRYLMGLGGKRLRPMLTLLSYHLFKDDIKEVVPYAAAVEAFHNFTLMHDDIMDKAPLRRGNPTVHKKWNVNTAILSGDVMLVKVYEMFLGVGPDKIHEVLRAFNKCAAEVCEGQQWDMEFEQTSGVTEKDYLKMIGLKTAVLLGFSFELGAILGDASDANKKALHDFGVNIGIGFQLKDDLLDAYADPKKFGKQVGGDIISNKKTYLLIKALEKSSGATRKQLQYWLDQKKFDKRKKVDGVKAIYDQLDIQRITERKINQYFTKAYANLSGVEADQNKVAIIKSFTDNLIERQS